MNFQLSNDVAVSWVSTLVVSSILTALEDLDVDIEDNLRKSITDKLTKPSRNGLTESYILDSLFMGITDEIKVIGLKIGAKLSLDILPEIETYLSSCRTPREALGALFLATKKLAPFLLINATERERLFIIYAEAPEKCVSFSSQIIIEILFSTIIKHTKILLKDKYCLDKVVFSHKLNGPINEYRRVFSSTIQAGSTFNAIVFPVCILDIELDSPMAKNNDEARSALQARLGDYSESGSLSEWVTNVIDLKCMRKTHLSNISDTMNISARTLQRKLSKEGTSFRKVSVDAKFKLSKKLLKSSAMSIKEISLISGFSDRRSFSRFFEKMSGVTPSKFRRMNRQN